MVRVLREIEQLKRQLEAARTTKPVIPAAKDTAVDTAPDGHGASRRCTPAQARAQLAYFSGAGVHTCPDERWMRMVRWALPRARTFIDVGANKGYFAAQVFALWRPWLLFGPKRVHKSLKAWAKARNYTNLGASQMCGVCQECFLNLLDLKEGASYRKDYNLRSMCRQRHGTLRNGATFCHHYNRLTGRPKSPRSLPANLSRAAPFIEAFVPPIAVHSLEATIEFGGIVAAMLERGWPLQQARAGAVAGPGAADADVVRDLLAGPLDPAIAHAVRSQWRYHTFAVVGKRRAAAAAAGGGGRIKFGVTDRQATRGWEKYGPFFEAGSLSRFSKNARAQQVPATTMDAFMADPNLGGGGGEKVIVDVLKIDTEGHDFWVLDGAEALLKGGRVRVLMFEYVNSKKTAGAWRGIAKPSLGDVSALLESWGFACWIPGTHGLVKATHGCYVPELSLGRRAWERNATGHRVNNPGLAPGARYSAQQRYSTVANANVLCAHTRAAAPLVRALDAFALAFAPPAVPEAWWRRAASFPPGDCEGGGNRPQADYRRCLRRAGHALHGELAARLCAFSRSAPAYAGVAASVGVTCPLPHSVV